MLKNFSEMSLCKISRRYRLGVINLMMLSWFVRELIISFFTYLFLDRLIVDREQCLPILTMASTHSPDSVYGRPWADLPCGGGALDALWLILFLFSLDLCLIQGHRHKRWHLSFFFLTSCWESVRGWLHGKLAAGLTGTPRPTGATAARNSHTYTSFI